MALARQLDFLLILSPVVIWGAVVYFFVFDTHDPLIDQWFQERPYLIAGPVIFTLFAMGLFLQRCKRIRHLLTQGTVVQGRVTGVSSKRRSAIPLKTVVTFEYKHKTVRYRRKMHLLSDDGLSPGHRVHVHFDPDKPGRGILREPYVEF